MSSPKPKTTTVEVPVKLVGRVEDGDPSDQLANAPLFALDDDKQVSHLIVIRTDPDEGTLGRMPPETSELDIKRKWGGGQYQIQGRDARNRMISGAFKTLQIAGDPNFESEAARRKWKRQQGLEEPAPPAPPAEQIGIREVFALLTSTQANQRQDADRRAAETEAAHKRELERLKLEAELRRQERAEEDARRERMAEEREERRRKEEDERDERRKREAEEREERRRKEDETARQRDREFQVAMGQLNRKGTADGSEMLLKGVELAHKLSSGGEDSDPVRAVAAAVLPRVLERFDGAKPAPAPTPAAPPGASAASITLDGAIGVKAMKAIEHLEREGFNAEQALDDALGVLLKARRKTAPDPPAFQGPAPAAAPSSPPAASKQTAPNGTIRVKGRTTKK